MKSLTNYYAGKTLIGVKITSITKGTTPLTPPKQPLQIIALKHKAGSYLKAHVHTPKERRTNRLQECLVVKSGKIKIDLYTDKKKFVQSVIVKEGQIFLSVAGGLGIHVLEDCEVFEFKNGPFLEDKQLI